MAEQAADSASAKTTADSLGTASENKQDWKAQKEQQAAKRKKENDLKKCEEAIERLEGRNTEIEQLMASPDICTDVARLQDLSKEQTENMEQLESLYEKWEELSES